jgi:hypothetical protein
MLCHARHYSREELTDVPVTSDALPLAAAALALAFADAASADCSCCASASSVLGDTDAAPAAEDAVFELRQHQDQAQHTHACSYA